MKTENNEVMIPGINTRRDDMDLGGKGIEVNERLKSLFSEYNFNFIDNSCISKERHLNNGGLHLNIKGTYAWTYDWNRLDYEVKLLLLVITTVSVGKI